MKKILVVTITVLVYLSIGSVARADSVYFGIETLHMRSGATQAFTLEALPEIAQKCCDKNIRSYLTLNTILYDDDLPTMQKMCDAAKKVGITAVIASDIAAIQYAHSIGLEVHISVQANVSNLAAVKFFAQYADVVVLARELTLDQIKDICDRIKKEKIVGPQLKDGKKRIKEKLEFLCDFQGEVQRLHGQGLNIKAIMNQLPIKDMVFMKYMTFGNVSLAHMIKSALNTP